MIATFHASGRPATNRHLVDAGLHGLLRAVGWSIGLALAALLIAPTTARAADPDAGGSLLGGLTDGLGLGDIVQPVEDVVEPVTDPLLDPIVEPVIDPVVEPVTALVTPLVEPVDNLVDPVLEPLIKPIVEPVVQPLAGVVAAATTPVDDVLDPVLEPLEGVITGTLPGVEDVLGAAPVPLQTPSANDAASSLPIDVDLPTFTQIPPGVADVAPPGHSEPVAATPLRRTATAPVAHEDGTVFDVSGRAPNSTTPAVDPGSIVGASADHAATMTGPRVGPIGSFGGLGSGHAVSGVSFAIGAALGLLLLFLLPPPFRVSRLHLAAVFWRPQHFVGPLVPPG